MEQQNAIYDVVIAGAGPVGLFLAYKMRCLGHSVYICDPKLGPTDQSRAVLLTSRTMEIFALNGIAEHFLKEAIIAQGMEAHYKGSTLGTISVATTDLTPFPQMTLLVQEKTEAIFIDLLEKMHSSNDVKAVEWRTEVCGYSQHDDYVEVQVRNVSDDTNKTSTIRGRYLVGCDGTHSVVRRKHGDWKYEGYSVDTQFVLADIALEGRDADRVTSYRAHAFMHPTGFCGLIPIGKRNGKDYFRLVNNLTPYQVAKSDDTTHGISRTGETVTLDRLKELMEDRLNPLDIRPVDPVWSSVFRINERKANGFRRGRAFVVGDAAHCHSPVGGQGLNLGFQDVDNIAWKLSLVLNGRSTNVDKLLDSYTIERDPIVKSTMTNTGSMTRLIFSGGFISDIMTYLAVSALTSIERLQKYIVTNMMQVTIHLGKDSPILLPSSSLLIESGRFMPETCFLRKRVINDKLEFKTLYQILQGVNRQHAIIWVCTRPSKYDPCPWTEAFLTKADRWKHATRPIVVESTWHVHDAKLPSYVAAGSNLSNDIKEDTFWMENNWEMQDALTKRIGLDVHLSNVKRGVEPPAAIAIIRPDGYIASTALIQSADDINKALTPLETYLALAN